MKSERLRLEHVMELDGLRLAELRAAATECVCSRRHAAVGQSAGSHPNTVSEKDILDSMTESGRQEQARWQTELARAEDALKSLNKAPGLSSEWADLAQAMFNLKEFIFIQ
jgi:hypothetical protein